MPTRELKPNELQSALDHFSKNHQGWRTVLEDTGAKEGRSEAQNLPLVGISVDDRDGENDIVIMLGDQPDRHLTHIINQPAKVRITEGTGNSEETLEIEAQDGSRTVVRLYANANAASPGNK